MSILSSSSGKQEKVLREISAIAGGTIPHIKTPLYTKDDLKEIKSEYEDLTKKAAKSTKVSDMCVAIFATANYRDAVYSTRGRKFMRAAGLNGKTRAAWGRVEGLDWMQK